MKAKKLTRKVYLQMINEHNQNRNERSFEGEKRNPNRDEFYF